jgi:hypothetical protein
MVYCSGYYLSSELTEDHLLEDDKEMLKFIDDNKFDVFKYHSSEEMLLLIKNMAKIVKNKFNLKFEEE